MVLDNGLHYTPFWIEASQFFPKAFAGAVIAVVKQVAESRNFERF